MALNPLEYIDEIENWMDQIKDESLRVEDYDFLDKLSHGGSSNNGNNGVANVGAYLAIYEKDGELTVDEELVKALESRQESGKKRISNIVYEPTSKKREGNTLKEKEVDGHKFIQNMIDEFKQNADYQSTNENNTTQSKTQNQKTTNGGENEMTEAPEYVDETYELLDNLGTALDRKDIETAERMAESVKGHIEETYGNFQDVEDSFQEYDESMREHLEEFTDRLDSYLEDLGEMNQKAHNTARILMETERTLQEYELDDRTEELMDIAEEL